MQRIIAAHEDVATAAEPSFLVPPMAAASDLPIYAPWGGQIIQTGVHDLLRSRGTEWYDRAIGDFGRSAFNGLSRGKKYFLDKTPRNGLFARQLVRAFPDSKFIFLWRHPGAIAASMLNTWHQGNWRMHRFKIDFEESLLEFLAAANSMPNALHIQYENLVRDPEVARKKLGHYLDIEIPAKMAGRPDGRLGDPSKGSASDEISASSPDAWVATFCNKLRRKWLLRVMERTEEAGLDLRGYSLQQTKQAFDEKRPSGRYLLRDATGMGLDWLAGAVPISVMRTERRRHRSGRPRYTIH